MENKKIINVMLDRIKYFINAIENGEYEPVGYEFTIKIHHSGKLTTIDDSYFKN